MPDQPGGCGKPQKSNNVCQQNHRRGKSPDPGPSRSNSSSSNDTNSSSGSSIATVNETTHRDASKPFSSPAPPCPTAAASASPANTATATSIPPSHKSQKQQLPSVSCNNLKYDLSRLQRSDWVNLEGLATSAASRLGKEKCVGISELGRGSHNSLYQLKFSDSTVCAASISNAPPRYFYPQIKLSEIATMQYLLQSPRYSIPIPEVYDWNLTFDNPVGAPYVLREVVIGKNMAEDGRFYRLKSQDKMKVIRELALVQAELSKPSEFTKIGSIYHRGKDKSEFYVGELISAACGEDFPEEDEEAVPSKGPYSSLPELWQARLERETLLAIRNWSSSTSEPSKTSLSSPSKANPQQFGEVLQLLSGLTSLFTPPQELSTLCIHHSDLAIRNVLFDEKTLKITGVIDWEFAAVVPLVITGRFPNDLGWEGNEFARSLGKLGNAAEQWNHHYYDWTSLEGVTPPPAPNGATPESSLSTTPCPSSDYLSAPNTSPPTPPSSDEKCLPCSNQHSGEETPIPTTPTPQQTSKIPSPPSPPLPPPPTSQTPQKDLDIRAARLVQLFYLRKYYASCVASRDFTLTRLFIDSIAYVKFNEIVMGGHDKWFSAIEWIREVFWRLKTLGEDEVELGERLRGGRAVVKVPEVFAGRADRGVVDLGGWEDRLRRKGVGAAPIVERSL